MRPLVPRQAIAAPILLLAALSFGCVVPGTHVSAGYGVGFYGPPVGWHYGAWGPRYRVAPFHAPVRSRAFVSTRRRPHAFHAAHFGRPVPTIPRRRKLPTRRWPALSAPPVQWAYRFDERTYASDLVVAPMTAHTLAGRACGLVSLEDSREAQLVALRLTQ